MWSSGSDVGLVSEGVHAIMRGRLGGESGMPAGVLSCVWIFWLALTSYRLFVSTRQCQGLVLDLDWAQSAPK